MLFDSEKQNDAELLIRKQKTIAKVFALSLLLLLIIFIFPIIYHLLKQDENVLEKSEVDNSFTVLNDSSLNHSSEIIAKIHSSYLSNIKQNNSNNLNQKSPLEIIPVLERRFAKQITVSNEK